MDLPTLLGLQDNPATLAGYGELPPTLARALAADGAWRRLIYQPTSGALLDLGRRTYRPSRPLADYVRARDVTCIFPGCNRRAECCDLDHSRPFRPGQAGGATDRANLRPVCAKHHRLKHEAGWTLRASETGPPTWISPLGQQYPVEEYDYRPPDDADFDLPPLPPEPVPPEPVPHEPVPPEPSDTRQRGTAPPPWTPVSPTPGRYAETAPF